MRRLQLHLFSSVEMPPSTVTFQRSDTTIFLYIVVICEKDDVMKRNLISVDCLKTKSDIKEIQTGFLLTR